MTDTTETVLTDIRTELRGVRTEIQGVRTELRGELQGLRSDMREDFRTLLTRQDRNFYWVLAALVGLLAVMARGFRWF
jgi:hypothetical protein